MAILQRTKGTCSGFNLYIRKIFLEIYIKRAYNKFIIIILKGFIISCKKHTQRGAFMLSKEKLIKSERIFEGKIINLRVDTVEVVQNGNITTRELVEHPGGVGIVAVTKENKVCMVKQYRRPFDEMIMEIPAGKLEWGEDHYHCGVRELREETGYSAEQFIYLGEFYATPGFCNEKIHIYLATGLHAGENDLDENEFIELYEYSFDDLIDMIMENKIKDGKTVIGVLKAYTYLKRNNIL